MIAIFESSVDARRDDRLFESSVARARRYATRALTLDVTLGQACVLVELDGGSVATTARLIEATGLDADELGRTLESLEEFIAPAPGDARAARVSLSNARARIAVAPPRAADAAPLRNKVVESVRRDRQYAVDATIVRVMKARKTSSHRDLVAAVLSALVHPSSAAQIKARVESLIDREYLERDRRNPDTYNYLA